MAVERFYFWTDFLAVVKTRALVVQYRESEETFTIYGYDGPETHVCTIWKGAVPDGVLPAYTQEQNDLDREVWEQTFKTTANAVLVPRAKDGRLATRTTYTNRTISYSHRVVSFYTAKPDSLHNINPVDDKDWGDVKYRMFDAQNNELPADGVAKCVKVWIDWEPKYNYEVIGGGIDIDASLRDGDTNKWYVSAIGAPDYPPSVYGQLPFVGEMNLEAVGTSRVMIDGRAIQLMAYMYMDMPHTNLIRFIFKHPEGESKRFQVHLDHFM